MRANRSLESAACFVGFLVIVVLTLITLAFLSFAIASLMASEWFYSSPFWAKWLICALFVVWFRAGHAITVFKKAWARILDYSPIGEEKA